MDKYRIAVLVDDYPSGVILSVDCDNEKYSDSQFILNLIRECGISFCPTHPPNITELMPNKTTTRRMSEKGRMGKMYIVRGCKIIKEPVKPPGTSILFWFNKDRDIGQSLAKLKTEDNLRMIEEMEWFLILHWVEKELDIYSIFGEVLFGTVD